MNDLGQRIRQRRIELGLTQDELAKRVGYSSRSSVNKIEIGKNLLTQPKIIIFAKALQTTPSYLMGWDESPKDELFNNSSIRPVTLKRFPILGEIACGKPIFASEEHEAYVDASANIKADFCVTARGDSMTGARIFNGDIVFIKEQSMVENGQIAAVVIDNEVTLKRWYYYPDKSKLVLQAENPNYEPFVYVGEELNTIRCLGRAVSFMSNL